MGDMVKTEKYQSQGHVLPWMLKGLTDSVVNLLAVEGLHAPVQTAVKLDENCIMQWSTSYQKKHQPTIIGRPSTRSSRSWSLGTRFRGTSLHNGLVSRLSTQAAGSAELDSVCSSIVDQSENEFQVGYHGHRGAWYECEPVGRGGQDDLSAEVHDISDVHDA